MRRSSTRARAGRFARRVELGIGGGGCGGSGGSGDRHRDLGLAVVAGLAMRPGHGQADRRSRQPCRHRPDRAQPGHRRPADPHRARRGAAAERAGRRRPARPGDGRSCERPADYTAALDDDGLSGARIGVPSDPADPENDVYYGRSRRLPPRSSTRAIAAIEALGATIVRANMPTAGWIGGPGTEIAILNRNRESRTWRQPVRRPLVFVYELKHDLDLYLRDWATETEMRSLADIVAFNAANAERALRFGQDLFLAAAATRGDLCELEYAAARQMRSPFVAPPGPRRLSWTGTGSMRCCFRVRQVPRSPPRPAIRACGPGRLCRRRRNPGLPVRRHLHRPRVERARAVALRLCLRAGDPSPPPAAAHRDLV